MKNEDILSLMDRIDPALVEEAGQLPPKKRRPRLRAVVIAACACLALLGSAFAAGAIGGQVTAPDVNIRSYYTDEEISGHDIFLRGVERFPLDNLPEDILALSSREFLERSTVAEAEEDLGMQLAGFAPFEASVDSVEIQSWDVDGNPHRARCLMSIRGLRGNPDIIEISARYITYPPHLEPVNENNIQFEVTAYVFTEHGQSQYNTLPGGYATDAELELGSLTTSSGLELPIITETRPSPVYDMSTGEPVYVRTEKYTYVYTYYVQNGVLYKVMVWGNIGTDTADLLPALERVLNGDNA